MRDTSRLHSITALLSAWRTDPDVHANIAAWRMRSARPARFVPLPEDLAPVLADSLRARGIGELYTHQATAWKEARAGKNLVIVTGTASGKTLCYNLPVLDRNFTKFLLLTPGTQQMSWNHAASENPQASAQTVVNGQTFSGTGYQLDGSGNDKEPCQRRKPAGRTGDPIQIFGYGGYERHQHFANVFF